MIGEKKKKQKKKKKKDKATSMIHKQTIKGKIDGKSLIFYSYAFSPENPRFWFPKRKQKFFFSNIQADRC